MTFKKVFQKLKKRGKVTFHKGERNGTDNNQISR